VTVTIPCRPILELSCNSYGSSTLTGSSGISWGRRQSAATPALQGTDSNTGISFPAADTVAINTGGSERTRVDSSGRLLVGTSSARSNIASFTPNFQIEGTNLNATVSAIRNSDDPGGASLILGKSKGTSIGSNTIVADGNALGIVRFFGNDGSNFVEAARILAEVDGTPGANDMPGRLVFSTTADGASSPTERMRIKNTGEINTYRSTTGDSFLVSYGGNSGDAADIYAAFHSASGVGTGTLCFRVRANGDVRNTNNSYGSVSDIKLKENIVDASSQWDDLKALQVRKYNFKEETGQETHTQIGLIAQEVELVSPGLVTESPDRDEEGNDLGTVTKSVNYSVLYMKAVKALQEAMERIEQLEAKGCSP
jgi:hypothetical protein